MKVNIKNLKGELFEINSIEATDKVEDLKKKLVVQCKVDIKSVTLVYNGSILNNEATISSLQLNSDRFIVMVLKDVPSSSTANQQKPPITQKNGLTNQTAVAASGVKNTSDILSETNFKENVNKLVEMGFNSEQAKKALMAAFNNPERAVEYLMTETIPSLDEHSSKKDILNRITDQINRVKIYEDLDLQDLARDEIPIAELHEKAHKSLLEHSMQNTSFHEELMKALLFWFKNQYFKWVDKLDCENCFSKNTVRFTGTVSISNEEKIGGAGRVENCFSDLKVLMKTRRGRCGEWANVFTLFCKTLGFEARYCLDFTDHVWTEASVGANHVVDVIRRYSRKDEVYAKRRNHLDENWLKKTISEINNSLLSKLSKDKQLEMLRMLEQEEEDLKMLFLQKISNSNELDGRQSGSVEWRMSRGEIGNALHSKRCWEWKKTFSKTINIASSSETSLIGSAAFSNFPEKNATLIPEKSVMLTTGKPSDKGATYFIGHTITLKLENSVLIDGRSYDCFGVEFFFKITNKDGGDAMGGADGFSFLLNSHGGDVIGEEGAGLGYSGIPNSVAVEFDTYASVDRCADPSDNHISIQTRGNLPNSSHHQYSKACTSHLPRMNNGQYYSCQIIFNLKLKAVRVYLTDLVEYTNSSSLKSENFQLVLDLNNFNLYSHLGAASSNGTEVEVFLGFTASSGFLTQRTDIGKVQIFGC
ncbi:peptide-N4-(N-acetyl-beta- glucosaminyl)asparagine amidase [Clydaea vesicula]|uniref:Peptide-N4-(N-acetyl-beta-glucosaminyl)asparagine amidase n=1 Tax=Clydaea vesicula TaxID=447962 RepID=A0AAD5U513_9FUNG|nr:peptide-N4-(N-acetyl-beta- glucosaminyl)asparagine amidase [Clydaea vesicula]